MLTTKTMMAVTAVALSLVLAGCAKNKLPPYPHPVPPSSPSRPSSMPSMPSPTPAPPSRPSQQPSKQPAPPNPDSSQQDPSAGVPSSSPPQASLPSPSLPGPRGDEQGKPASKTERGKKGSPSGAPDGDPDGSEDKVAENEEERRKAGEGLEKAGEDVAEAGRKNEDEFDPLDHSMPESQQDGDRGDSDNSEFEDPLLAENDSSGDPNADPNAEPGPEVSEIMQEVAEALRKAGVEVSNASNEEELRAAEEALAEAQVAVIVAEGDLEALREAGIDVDRQSEALGNAERQIMVASKVVLASRSDFPELPQGGASPPDELDVALEDSLIVFDDEMADVRRAGGGTGPAPEGPTVSSLPTRMPETEGATTATRVDQPPGELTDPDEGDLIAAVNVPEDIGDGQGDDIIARQLREAAIAEADPGLQEKLWAEYRRYKQGTR